jgi:hypothetical protein
VRERESEDGQASSGPGEEPSRGQVDATGKWVAATGALNPVSEPGAHAPTSELRCPCATISPRTSPRLPSAARLGEREVKKRVDQAPRTDKGV